MAARVDLLVTGRIATLAGARGLGWAGAVAVADGVVVAAGRESEVAALAGPATRRLRLGLDRVVLPGITDAHLHLAEAALAADQVDLAAAPTLEAGLALLAREAERLDREAAPDGWLVGHGWSADGWGAWPTASALDRAAGSRPAFVWAHDHHSAWADSAALRLAGIDEEAPDPPGGTIRRDATGVPTGILHERATTLVLARLPAPSGERLERALLACAAELLALGVTGVHDPGGLAAAPDLGGPFAEYRRLAAAGRLPVRVHASIRAEQLAGAERRGLRSGDGLSPEELAGVGGDPRGRRLAARYRVGWLKLFADGALGSRTAALLDPYEIEPGREAPAAGPAGALLADPSRYRATVARASATGIATQIHGIGDRAVRLALDLLAPTVGHVPLVPRVEHCQMVHPDDAGRFARSGVAASVQPIHLRSDRDAALAAWGARATWGYRLRSLDRPGALLAFGTDAPVEPADPWPGIAIAVTRRASKWGPGAGPFAPDEALTLDRALRAACLDPVVSAGEGSVAGRLVSGCRADLVVLPAAALDEPVRPGGALTAARPLLTLVDGEEAYRHPDLDA